MRRFLILGILALLAAACGGEEQESDVETVNVRLVDFGYELSRDTFVVGKPYRFVLRNEGELAHEWVIVPRGAEVEAAGIIEVPEGDLQPGATTTRTYTFLRPGSYDFACYIPGPPDHYEAGMIHPIEVVVEQEGGEKS